MAKPPRPKFTMPRVTPKEAEVVTVDASDSEAAYERQRAADRRADTQPAPQAQPVSPVHVLALATQGAIALLHFKEQSDRLMARLRTYRKLFPDRYGHLAAFTEGVDDPTPEQAAEYLAKADAALGGR